MHESTTEACPKDDEKHITFLSVAVQAYWRRGTALRLTYLLSKRMCEDKAVAQRIWLARLTTDAGWNINKVVEFKEECDKAIAKGKMTLDGMGKQCRGQSRDIFFVQGNLRVEVEGL